MNFSEQLNIYIEKLNCTSKELSEKSNISTATISRFRNGKRLPNLKTPQLDRISNGIFLIAQEKSINLSKSEVYSTLLSTLDNYNLDTEKLIEKFDLLINNLKISTTFLANSMGFSASLISKIKSGKRIPYKPQIFLDSFCKFIIKNYSQVENKKIVSELLNCSLIDIKDELSYYNKLIKWFSIDVSTSSHPINNFLNYLDDFDLNEYVKSIKFDEIEIPHIPFYIPEAKTYYGIEQLKQGQLDFFKATILSKSTNPIFLFTDIPIEDMAKDNEFLKIWMYSIATVLKKGIKINIIHGLNRPLKEMLIGLRSWIPLYMTGQISPYYFKNYKNNIYCNHDYISSSVALTGECIREHQETGKFNLITDQIELNHYKEKSEQLLKLATPLMDIYRIENKTSFDNFIELESQTKGNRRRILPTLPIFTISDDLLINILKRNQLEPTKIEIIIKDFQYTKQLTLNLLKENVLVDEIEELSETDFNSFPQLLFIANNFYEDKITYNYSEYLEHLELTKKFANKTPNYTLKINKKHLFKNIQIYIHENDFVMISKNLKPSIHFVIRHPKLINSIENFTTLIN